MKIELVCGCGRRHVVDAGHRPPERDAERYVGLREAADRTGISNWTLRRLVRAGEVPAVRGARGAYLVRVRDVQTWLRSRPVEPIEDHDDEQMDLVVAAGACLDAAMRAAEGDR